MIKYEIQRTSQFKKDFKLAVKRGCSVEKRIGCLYIRSLRMSWY